MGETDEGSGSLVVKAKRRRGGRAKGTKGSGREKTEEGSAEEGSAEEGSAEEGSAEEESAEVEVRRGVRVTHPMHKYVDRVSSRTSFCGSCTSLWLAPRTFSHFLTILHRQFVLIFCWTQRQEEMVQGNKKPCSSGR